MRTTRGIALCAALSLGVWACGSSSIDGSGDGTPASSDVGGSSAGTSGQGVGGTVAAAGTMSTSAGGNAVAGAGGAIASGGSTSTAGMSGTGETGGTSAQAGSAPVPPPNCTPTCTSASDCAVAGSSLYDASHYQCTAGTCQWLGCNSDDECQATFQKPGYACTQVSGASFKSCTPTCAAPADCATPTVPIYTASHYTCDSGVCAWQGCDTDAECQMSLGKANYGCIALAGTKLKSCQETCSAPADCATPSVEIYTADHYACDSGVCDWLGCKSTRECTDTLMKPNYMCK